MASLGTSGQPFVCLSFIGGFAFSSIGRVTHSGSAIFSFSSLQDFSKQSPGHHRSMAVSLQPRPPHSALGYRPPASEVSRRTNPYNAAIFIFVSLPQAATTPLVFHRLRFRARIFVRLNGCCVKMSTPNLQPHETSPPPPLSRPPAPAEAPSTDPGELGPAPTTGHPQTTAPTTTPTPR